MVRKDLSLHQKILKIADMAGVLQKSASGYSYKYVPEEDIQAKVTAGMQKYGVMLYNSIVPGTMNVIPWRYEKYDPKNKVNKPVNEVIVSADMTYTWINVDNPEERVETTWAFVGQMEDAAQALGAGLTYANRYYLMKQLQLATTESDPDNYRSKQKEADEYELKAEQERLGKKVKEVVDAGVELMKHGVDKATMMGIVAAYNNGNGNPSGIQSIEICESVLKAFDELKNKTNEEGEKK